MAPPLISFVGLSVFVLEIIVNGMIFFKLWNRWSTTRINVVAILCGFYLLYLIFVMVEFVLILFNFNDPVSFYLQEGVIVNLFPFFGGVSAGFFLLFIDYFVTDKVSSIHTGIYGAFIGAFILNVIYQMIFPGIIDEGNLIVIQQEGGDMYAIILLLLSFLITSNFPASYFVIYVLIISLVSLYRIKNLIQDEAQKKQVIFMQLTIVFYYFFTMVFIVTAYQFEDLFDPNMLVFVRYIAPHISVIIGSMMMYQAYAKAPTGFLQFQRIEKLMVINRSGLLLFSYTFDEDTRSDAQDVLLSGGIFAVMTLFSEMIKTKNIRMIHFQNSRIMLSHHDNFVVFLVVDKITSFLWSALESFTNMFNLKYGPDEQELAIVPKSLFEDTNILLKLAFGRQ
ncbi:MAG: hypothetical protein ACFE95_13665 [Candidatus Hodarchaeota archaeon]